MTAILDTPFMTYVGGCSNGELHGQGTILNKGNYLYSGKFNNGFAEGFGKLQLQNGYAYEGGILAGRFHGIGKLRVDNKTWVGRFLRNEFVQGQYTQKLFDVQQEPGEDSQPKGNCDKSELQQNDLELSVERSQSSHSPRKLLATIVQTGDFCDRKLIRGVVTYRSEDLTFKLSSNHFPNGILQAPQQFQLEVQRYKIQVFAHKSVLSLVDFVKVLLGQIQKPDCDQKSSPDDIPAVEVQRPKNLFTEVTKTCIDSQSNILSSSGSEAPPVVQNMSQRTHSPETQFLQVNRQIREQNGYYESPTIDYQFEKCFFQPKSQLVQRLLRQQIMEQLSGEHISRSTPCTQDKQMQTVRSSMKGHKQSTHSQTSIEKEDPYTIRLVVAKHYPDGSCYVGQSVNLTPHGCGRLFSAKTQSTMTGIFKSGRFLSGISTDSKRFMDADGFQYFNDCTVRRVTYDQATRQISTVTQSNHITNNYYEEAGDLKCYRIGGALDIQIKDSQCDAQNQSHVFFLRAKYKNLSICGQLNDKFQFVDKSQLRNDKFCYQFQYALDSSKLQCFKLLMRDKLILGVPSKMQLFVVDETGCRVLFDQTHMYRSNRNLIFETSVSRRIDTVQDCEQYEQICFEKNCLEKRQCGAIIDFRGRLLIQRKD